MASTFFNLSRSSSFTNTYLIQLLFIFNTKTACGIRRIDIFKYSYCSSSTLQPDRRFSCPAYLNTATVLLHLKYTVSHIDSNRHLNTASVLLQPSSPIFPVMSLRHLDTATVLLQLISLRLVPMRQLNLDTATVLLQPRLEAV